MYARVARWEGANAEGLRTAVENVRTAEGPPEGVPAAGITHLFDPEAGTALVVVYFQSEEDLRRGDEALRAMDPQEEGVGRVVSVETYEVGADRRL